MKAAPPDHVWIGYNSTRHAAPLPEPSREKVAALMERLVGAGLDVRGKELRGLVVPEREPPINTAIAMQSHGKGW